MKSLHLVWLRRKSLFWWQNLFLHWILAENKSPAHWAEKWMMGELGLGIFPFSHFVPSGPHDHIFYLGSTYVAVGGGTRLYQHQALLWQVHILYDFSLFKSGETCILAQSIVYPIEYSMCTLKEYLLWKLL